MMSLKYDDIEKKTTTSKLQQEPSDEDEVDEVSEYDSALESFRSSGSSSVCENRWPPCREIEEIDQGWILFSRTSSSNSSISSFFLNKPHTYPPPRRRNWMKRLFRSSGTVGKPNPITPVVDKDQLKPSNILKRFALRELKVATDSFSSKNILRRDGFSKVYKGRLADGSLVAVKRLKERAPGGEIRFQTEVERTSMAVHRNVLRLRGFCMTPTERLLVYPYMPNGSVASCLRERPPSEPPLDWPTRQRIALASARGLFYLHDRCDPKIIHRDVKAANILLDEEFEAVVGDFCLAKVMDYNDTHVTTAVRGTIGHIAPEYLSTGKLSEKTDVFGYGIMLLELITGQRSFNLARLANDDDVMLLDWVKGLLKEKKLEMLVDPDLQSNYTESEVEELIQVALLCTQGSPTDRPKMLEVVRMLEGDGLAGRWEELQKIEMIRQEEYNSEWILDSTYNLEAIELSAPR